MSYKTAGQRPEPATTIVEALPHMRRETVQLVRNLQETAYKLSGAVHYFQLIIPDTPLGFWSDFWRYYLLGQRQLNGFIGKADQSSQAEKEFLATAGQHLKKSNWSEIIRKRANAILDSNSK
jgi:hypothetical protein